MLFKHAPSRFSGFYVRFPSVLCMCALSADFLRVLYQRALLECLLHVLFGGVLCDLQFRSKQSTQPACPTSLDLELQTVAGAVREEFIRIYVCLSLSKETLSPG